MDTTSIIHEALSMLYDGSTDNCESQGLFLNDSKLNEVHSSAASQNIEKPPLNWDDCDEEDFSDIPFLGDPTNISFDDIDISDLLGYNEYIKSIQFQSQSKPVHQKRVIYLAYQLCSNSCIYQRTYRVHRSAAFTKPIPDLVCNFCISKPTSACQQFPFNVWLGSKA